MIKHAKHFSKHGKAKCKTKHLKKSKSSKHSRYSKYSKSNKNMKGGASTKPVLRRTGAVRVSSKGAPPPLVGESLYNIASPGPGIVSANDTPFDSMALMRFIEACHDVHIRENKPKPTNNNFLYVNRYDLFCIFIYLLKYSDQDDNYSVEYNSILDLITQYNITKELNIITQNNLEFIRVFITNLMTFQSKKNQIVLTKEVFDLYNTITLTLVSIDNQTFIYYAGTTSSNTELGILTILGIKNMSIFKIYDRLKDEGTAILTKDTIDSLFNSS